MTSEDVVSTTGDLKTNSTEKNDEENGMSFRIRDVSEINSTVQDERNSEGIKRKLPAWLSSPDDGNKKKTKHSNRDKSNGEGSSTNALQSEDGENLVAGSVDEVSCNNLRTASQDGIQEEDEVQPRRIKVEPADADEGMGPEGTSKNEGGKEVKVEPGDADEDVGTEETSRNEGGEESEMPGDESSEAEVKVKVEDQNSGGASSSSNTNLNTTGVKPTVVKEEATSTIRDSCKYGIRCYRRNPAHRVELAHPGDSDYRRPNYPPPPKGTPDCPFGDRCYRRNPTHFQDYSHPPSTDFKKNWQLRQKRLRKQKKEADFVYYDDDDESDLEDPFESDASSDEYVPSDD